MTDLTATDFALLSTSDLTATFNATFDKNVKVGSYTRGKMIAALAAHLEATQPEDTNNPIEFEAGSNEATPYPVSEEEVAPTPTAEELLDQDRCPLCGADASSQTAAGVEGTFLGDTCNFCHECGKTYNCITGEEVNVPTEGKSKKRRILNPQVKIDAKVEACAKEGIEVFYDKTARLWTFTDNQTGGLILHMPSRHFSEFTPTELAAYAAARRPQ